MRNILAFLRNIFFKEFIGELNLYTIVSSVFKFILVFIVLYYIYIIVKLIILDIKNVEISNKIEKSYITVIDENGDKSKFLLENKTTIGRSKSNDIILENNYVSKNHANIIKSEGSYYIVDNNSANGTILNGEVIFENLELLNDDVIEIGGYKLLYTRELQDDYKTDDNN